MVLCPIPDYFARQVCVTSMDFLILLMSVDGGNFISNMAIIFLFE